MRTGMKVYLYFHFHLEVSCDYVLDIIAIEIVRNDKKESKEQRYFEKLHTSKVFQLY